MGVDKCNHNFKLDFLKKEFWANFGVPFKFYFRNFHNFSKEFFSLYRAILEFKNNAGILRKNGLFENKTCCGLTALFLKTKIYFVVLTLQVNK